METLLGGGGILTKKKCRKHVQSMFFVTFSSFCGGGESMVPFPAHFFHFLGVGEGGDLMVPSTALFFFTLADLFRSLMTIKDVSNHV